MLVLGPRPRVQSPRKHSLGVVPCCSTLPNARLCPPTWHSGPEELFLSPERSRTPPFLQKYDSLPSPLIQAILINTFDRALVSSMSGTWFNMCKFTEYHNTNIQCSWCRLRKGSGKGVQPRATKETTGYHKLVGTWLYLRYISKGDSPMICINTNV